MLDIAEDVDVVGGENVARGAYAVRVPGVAEDVRCLLIARRHYTAAQPE